jgi:cystathionine beta-synthase
MDAHRKAARFNVLDTIGNTPLVELPYLSEYTGAKVLAKLECFNPGLSIKDRIVRHMIERAEKQGKIKPGDTIVEATSGNTGYSLAMIAGAKGYKCIVTVKDNISRTKVTLMEGFGAEVVMCPASARPDSPEFYMNKARNIANQIKGGFYLNQNDDPGNAEAHYTTTGPEIWYQTEGKITHLIACASTGGTISGTARFLKEKNPHIKAIAVDSVGSYLRPYFETGKIPENVPGSTQMEGVGKKIIPRNMDFNIIDRFVTVEDGPSAQAAITLCNVEGLMMGYSSGGAIEGLKQIKDELKPTDVVVLIFPDHGCKYLDKIYDPVWMYQKGYSELTEHELNMISLVL